MRLSELLADEVWRHQDLDIDPGEGGSDPSAFPYGPGDPAGGSYEGPTDPSYNGPTQPAEGGYYNPPSYDTGPPRYQSYYHRPSPPPKPAPPPDPWAGVSPQLHDASTTAVENFLKSINWPDGFDINGSALRLAKSNTNVTGSQFDAYEWLYENTLNQSQQQAMPWARVGLDKDAFTQKVESLNAAYFNYTGTWLSNNDNLGDLAGDKNVTMLQAIRGNWLPSDLLNFAMYGNPAGGNMSQLLDQAKLTGSMPWLSQGQTYTQALQQFTSFEQQTPTDRNTLAAFYRFGVGAKQVGGGVGAFGTVAGTSAAWSQSQLERGTSTVR